MIFSWIDDRGVYLADGTYYEISYDGGLQNQIANLEYNYPIEFEGDIKEIMGKINNTTHFIYNVSGKYYLKDINEEEVKLR